MRHAAHGARAPLPRELADLANRALRRTLALDPDALAALRELEGRLLRLELQGPDLALTLRISGVGLEVVPDAAGPADVCIRGTPRGVLSYIGRRPAAGSGLEITGDVALAQRLQQILANLDPDWEELLSRWMGDMAARQAGNALRAFAGWSRDAVRSLGLDTEEYLRFEQRLLADREEVDAFTAGVDHLRDDVERLRARLARLERSS